MLMLFVDLLIICSVVQRLTEAMSFKERRLSNGSIGFSIVSPSLDRHLWVVRCRYGVREMWGMMLWVGEVMRRDGVYVV